MIFNTNVYKFYESALELNVWNKTQVISSARDQTKKQWTVTVERIQDGKKVTSTLHYPLLPSQKPTDLNLGTLHPRHIVQATGLNGELQIPSIPGMETFKGTILHFTQFDNASPEYKGKKVIVVGTGTSGHDTAGCCYRHGADVTIVQRSPKCVASLTSTHKIVTRRYNEHIVSSSPLLTNSRPQPSTPEPN